MVRQFVYYALDECYSSLVYLTLKTQMLEYIDRTFPWLDRYMPHEDEIITKIYFNKDSFPASDTMVSITELINLEYGWVGYCVNEYCIDETPLGMLVAPEEYETSEYYFVYYMKEESIDSE